MIIMNEKPKDFKFIGTLIIIVRYNCSGSSYYTFIKRSFKFNCIAQYGIVEVTISLKSFGFSFIIFLSFCAH